MYHYYQYFVLFIIIDPHCYSHVSVSDFFFAKIINLSMINEFGFSNYDLTIKNRLKISALVSLLMLLPSLLFPSLLLVVVTKHDKEIRKLFSLKIAFNRI